MAEDVATLDVISNGRIDPGFGQGYAPHEFAGYGIPPSDRLSRFTEGLEVLQGLWSQDTYSHEGRHYHIDGARLVPKPVQQPMPLWIGATSRPGVRRAGRLGANLLGISAALQEDYEEARRAAGFDVESAKILHLMWAHMAASDDAAWEEAAPHFHHLLTVYAGWANAAALAGGPKAPPVPPVEELRNPKGRLMFRPAFGSSATVAEGLNRALGRVRTTHLAIGLMPGMDPRRPRRPSIASSARSFPSSPESTPRLRPRTPSPSGSLAVARPASPCSAIAPHVLSAPNCATPDLRLDDGTA